MFQKPLDVREGERGAGGGSAPHLGEGLRGAHPLCGGEGSWGVPCHLGGGSRWSPPCQEWLREVLHTSRGLGWVQDGPPHLGGCSEWSPSPRSRVWCHCRVAPPHPPTPALLWRMEELGEALRSHYGLDDFAPLSLPAQVTPPSLSPCPTAAGTPRGAGGWFPPRASPNQEPVTVLGQIGCDSTGKLNARSVLLEADGHRIPLDLSELPEFSLFPGQVGAGGVPKPHPPKWHPHPWSIPCCCPPARWWHWRGPTAAAGSWW